MLFPQVNLGRSTITDRRIGVLSTRSGKVLILTGFGEVEYLEKELESRDDEIHRLQGVLNVVLPKGGE